LGNGTPRQAGALEPKATTRRRAVVLDELALAKSSPCQVRAPRPSACVERLVGIAAKLSNDRVEEPGDDSGECGCVPCARADLPCSCLLAALSGRSAAAEDAQRSVGARTLAALLSEAAGAFCCGGGRSRSAVALARSIG